MGKMIPVWRDDGESYACHADAARAVLAESGVTDPDKRTITAISKQISRAIRGDRCKRAYGHRWFDHDFLAERAELMGLEERVKALEAECGQLRAKLENANDRLRENGLEQE